MIKIEDLNYRVILVIENKKQYNITDYVEGLGWEENEGELAVRLTFSMYNGKTKQGKISSLVKLGCLILVYADCGSVKKEAARGYVTEWKQALSQGEDRFEATCYDELYFLQTSQDNLYFPSGMKTKSILGKIFKAWGIPIGKFEGPDVTHGKMIYRSENLSDVLLDILNEAKKKSGKKPLLRAEKGRIHVMEWGSNDTVYHFESENTKMVSFRKSTQGLVTRVKVISQKKDEKRQKVEAALDGLTQYGIRQKIYIRDKDDSLDAAKKAAQSILNKEGKPKNDITVQGPDVPYIRKGDMVHIEAGALKGCYLVTGIMHNADSGTMSMDLKKASGTKVKKNKIETTEEAFQAGDVVRFKGGTHYVDSSAGAKGYPAKAGLAKITKINGKGRAHPWHLIHMDEGNVYGWVDDGTFTLDEEVRGDGISWQSGNK